MIKATIMQIPKGQARPRQGKNGFYNPSSKYKQGYIQELALFRPNEPLHGNLITDLTFYMPIPKSTLKKAEIDLAKKEMLPHNKKPDLDNLAKLVLDALEECKFFTNDSQIFKLNLSKFYSLKPRIEINIQKI